MVHISFITGAAAALMATAAAKEINMLGVASAEEYTSGAVHEKIMTLKNNQWDAEVAAGEMASELYSELGYTRCIDGLATAIPGDANNTFRCSNIDLYHFQSHAQLGSASGFGSSSWGWTSADGREFVAVAQFDGTAFVEISSEGKMIYLGRLPQYDPIGSRWREIRTLGSYAIIGSEAFDHGVQIFDMQKLLTLDPASPTIFTQADLTGWFNELPKGRTHNVVVNEELGYAIAVGSVNDTRANAPCKGGLIYMDMTDPANPVSPGCAAADGYVHDAQCLVYRGPDTRYAGRDICYGYNEDTVTIYDVTNKTGNTSTIISRITYEGATYIHQGVVLDEMNQEFIMFDDELDERDATVGPATAKLPITYILDIRDLEKPVISGYFQGNTRSIDHNQYIFGGLNYQSNYGAGLRVLDVTSVPADPTGAGVCEAGFFDVHPADDAELGGGLVAFAGTWSSYGGFKSGFIYINTIERGSFVVKMTSKTCPAA